MTGNNDLLFTALLHYSENFLPANTLTTEHNYKVPNEFPVMIILADDKIDQTTRWHH